MNRYAVTILVGVFAANLALADPATDILKETGVTGGLIVHLGCGDGAVTAALHANDGYLVQGLDTSAENVGKARKTISAKGLYGKVTARAFGGRRLPYRDNMVNLIVASDAECRVPNDEIMRVVAPLGVAYVKQGGRWTKTVKPWPEGMDEWQQHFHDADNNAVAHDRLVGPPRRYQWIAVTPSP